MKSSARVLEGKKKNNTERNQSLWSLQESEVILKYPPCDILKVYYIFSRPFSTERISEYELLR